MTGASPSAGGTDIAHEYSVHALCMKSELERFSRDVLLQPRRVPVHASEPAKPWPTPKPQFVVPVSAFNSRLESFSDRYGMHRLWKHRLMLSTRDPDIYLRKEINFPSRLSETFSKLFRSLGNPSVLRTRL